MNGNVKNGNFEKYFKIFLTDFEKKNCLKIVVDIYLTISKIEHRWYG